VEEEWDFPTREKEGSNAQYRRRDEIFVRSTQLWKTNSSNRNEERGKEDAMRKKGKIGHYLFTNRGGLVVAAEIELRKSKPGDGLRKSRKKKEKKGRRVRERVPTCARMTRTHEFEEAVVTAHAEKKQGWQNGKRSLFAASL